MIIPRKVQNAMENQDLDFVGYGVAQCMGIAGCTVGGNGDVATETFYKGWRRKGQHVGRVVFAAKLRVQLTHAPTAGHQKRGSTFQTGRSTGIHDKIGQSAITQPWNPPT